MSIQAIAPLLIKYQYIIMLGLMIVEGPIVGFVAAFLAAKGIFSFGIVYLLSISGDVIGDCAYYGLGRFAREYGTHTLSLKERPSIGDRIRIRVAKQIKILENKPYFQDLHEKMEKHFFLALLIVKVTPPISCPGHISFGFFKIPFLKFLTRTTIICIISESIFLNLGYFSSLSANIIQKEFNTITRIISSIVLAGLALVAGFFIFKKIKAKIQTNIKGNKGDQTL